MEFDKEASLARDAKAIEEEKRQDRQEEKPQFSSFVAQGGYLYEQILTEEGSRFLMFKDGNHAILEKIKSDKGTIKPLLGEEIDLGAILLPTGVAEYGDTKSLLKDVEAHVFKYLDVTPSFRKFAAYYILLSWLYDRLHTLPYLRALGDTGCGKSRFLDVVGRLCYKPTIVSGCITPAPIYRMIRRWEGTIILDEADLKNSDEYHEVITILNCGFERGRPVIRATKDNPDKLQFLPTFGPKVFATRRRFKDAALEARCLTEIMQETDRQDIPPVLDADFHAEEAELRNKLLLFRLHHFQKINPSQVTRLDIPNLEPRLKQISQAFGAVFANFDEVLEDFTAFILNHQKELIEQRSNTLIGQIVDTLFNLVETVRYERLERLEMPDGLELLPISSKNIADRFKDKDVDSRKIGQILKNLGLETRPKWLDGETRRLIVKNDQVLAKLKRRYIPAGEGEAPFVPCEPCKPSVLNAEDSENSTEESHAEDSSSHRTQKEEQEDRPLFEASADNSEIPANDWEEQLADGRIPF